MPNRPLGPCRDPSCPDRAVKAGRCAAHQAEDTRRYEQGRESSSARGYDRRWRRYRDRFLGDVANLFCATCGLPALEVDHIVPVVDGPKDPLFWAPTNHQALCHDCHSRKTVADGRWKGRTARAAAN